MIKDYNETRTWPIDNAQKLITMDDKYVSLLQIEEDQATLNEKAFEQLAITKLKNLQATVLENLETKLRKKNLTNANYEAAESEAFLKDTMQDTIDAAIKGTEVWDKFIEKRRAAYNISSSDYDKAVKEATIASENELKTL